MVAELAARDSVLSGTPAQPRRNLHIIFQTRWHQRHRRGRHAGRREKCRQGQGLGREGRLQERDKPVELPGAMLEMWTFVQHTAATCTWSWGVSVVDEEEEEGYDQEE